MALNTSIRAGIDALLTGTTDLGSTSAPLAISYTKSLSSGTATGQADLVYADVNTLAASATLDVDLAGTLPGALGGTVVFAKVKAILLYADEGNTNNVVLGGAAATQFVGPFGAATHTVAVQPGGVALLSAPGAGWTVAAGSTDFLRVANSAGSTSVTYRMIIVGTSA